MELDNLGGVEEPLLGAVGSNREHTARRRHVKLSMYRIINMGVVMIIGTTKAILSFLGQSVTPTALEWVGGVLLAVGLYYLGLYEEVADPRWAWLFEKDYSQDFGYYFVRAILIFIGAFTFCTFSSGLTFGVVIYTLGILNLYAKYTGVNFWSCMLVFVFNGIFTVLGFRIYAYLEKVRFIRRTIIRTWAWISRGQSTPKHFPWWLDAFTTISAAILSLLLFYFRLLDMYLAAVQALVRRLPPEE